MITRRAVTLGFALGNGLAVPAMAQPAYPTRAITLIVPFAPGGNIDILARLIAPGLGKRLGQTIVVENKPGAGSLVALQYVARAPADGYTVAITATGSFTMAPKMVPAAPYKPTDFTGVGTVGVTPMTLEVNAAGKFKTIGEFMAYAKAHPDQVTVGHSGNGTTNHETILLLEIASGVKFNVVAYRGSGPAINDLLGGQIDAMVDQLSASLPYIRDGKFRAIAITTKDRSPDLPDVPTLTESGQDVDTNTATGLLVPAKTPASVVAALNKALNETIQDAEVQTRLRELGATPLASTTAQFADMLKLEEARAADLIKRGLLTVQ